MAEAVPVPMHRNLLSGYFWIISVEAMTTTVQWIQARIRQASLAGSRIEVVSLNLRLGAPASGLAYFE